MVNWESSVGCEDSLQKKQLEMGEVPGDWVRIRELTDEQAFTLAFVENEDRENLSEMGKAAWVRGTLDADTVSTSQYHQSDKGYEELGKMINKSRKWVQRYDSLNDLHQLIQIDIANNVFRVTPAFELARIKDLDVQLELYNSLQTKKTDEVKKAVEVALKREEEKERSKKTFISELKI